jgi:type III secretion protein U
VSEKTRAPTAKRRADARKEGNVAQTQSIPHLLAAGGVFELVAATSPHWLGEGPLLLGSYISRLGETDAATRLAVKDLLFPLGGFGLALVMAALILAAVLALIGNVAQTGIIVATDALARLDRLSPIAHAKNMFSMEQLQNLLMSSFKAIVIFGCVAAGLLGSLNSLMHMAEGTLAGAALTMIKVALRCERMALLLLMIFVFIDWVIRKRSHTQQLRMSREEVEREQKDQFGDKHVRQGRNDFRRDMLAGELTENTRKANAVVTNPTHFAVALLYDPKRYPLPVVVARGTGAQAALMRRIARDSRIPVIRSVRLARMLYSTGREWHPVPRITLKAVAAVYRVVAEISSTQRHPGDPVELNEALDLDGPS